MFGCKGKIFNYLVDYVQINKSYDKNEKNTKTMFATSDYSHWLVSVQEISTLQAH